MKEEVLNLYNHLMDLQENLRIKESSLCKDDVKTLAYKYCFQTVRKDLEETSNHLLSLLNLF